MHRGVPEPQEWASSSSHQGQTLAAQFQALAESAPDPAPCAKEQCAPSFASAPELRLGDGRPSKKKEEMQMQEDI